MSAKQSTILAFASVVALAIPLSAQEQADTGDPWAPVRKLQGAWEGTGKGFGQTSSVTHKWEFVFDGKFLRLETRSVSESAAGDRQVHQDVGYVSWSGGEGILRFRHFLGEGFVNTFKLQQATEPQAGLNFEPEGTEGMQDMVARMTLRFQDADTYKMVLELGAKGQELKPCQTMIMRRSK